MKVTAEQLEKIESWIDGHMDRLVEDTCALIRIRSISDKNSEVKPFGPGCREVLEEYCRLGERYGLRSKNFEGYVAELYVPENAGKEKRIGLMGHLDVVPEGDNWLYPPYEGVVKGDWIIGRGSQDNKGPCLAAMYTVLCLRDLGIELKYDVCALAGTDEESGMGDAEYYAKRPEVPDLIIVTDSGFPICYAERGIASGWLSSKKSLSENIAAFHAGTATNQIPDKAEITLKSTPELLKNLSGSDVAYREEGENVVVTALGKAGHIIASHSAVNAIGVLTSLLLEHGLLADEGDRELFRVADSVVNSRDGKIFGLTEDEALSSDICYGCGMAAAEDGRLKVSFNIRCPVALDEAHVMKQVEKFADRSGFEPVENRILPSNYFPKERPVIQILNDVFNEVTGLAREPQVFVAGTHARKLPNAVAYGPGIPDQRFYQDKEKLFPEGHGSCHMPDEAQSIPALREALKIYILGVIALDGQELSKGETV